MSGIRLTVDLDLSTCSKKEAERAIRMIQAAFAEQVTQNFAVRVNKEAFAARWLEEADEVPVGGKPSEAPIVETTCLSDDPGNHVFQDPAEIFGAVAKVVDEAYMPVAPPLPVNVPLDAAGLRWDPRIHAESRNKVKDGTWRKKRGVDDAVVVAVEAELRGRAASNWAGGTENEVHFTAHGQLSPSVDPPNAVVPPAPSVAVPPPPVPAAAAPVPPPPPVAAAPAPVPPPPPPVTEPSAPPTTMAELAKWAAPSLVTGRLKQSALNDAAKAAGLVDQAGNGWFTGLGKHPEYVPAVYEELRKQLAVLVESA